MRRIKKDKLSLFVGEKDGNFISAYKKYSNAKVSYNDKSDTLKFPNLVEKTYICDYRSIP